MEVMDAVEIVDEEVETIMEEAEEDRPDPTTIDFLCVYIVIIYMCTCVCVFYVCVNIHIYLIQSKCYIVEFFPIKRPLFVLCI